MPDKEHKYAVQAVCVNKDPKTSFLTALFVLDDGKRVYVTFSPRILSAFIRQALECLL